MLLTGTKVLDLSSLMAGPYCTLLLAGMGAEVVKVEPPRGGDPIRHLGPPFINGESCLFLSLNWNKKGITLDLTRPEGLSLFYRLLASTDVLVENFLPNVAERLGVHYEAVKERNPKVVYCSISAYGQGGPLKDTPGTDPIFQGLSGVMMINGRPGDPPVRLGFPVADITAGIFAAYAISSSLFSRERTGRGEQLDVSVLHSLVALQGPRVAEFLATGRNPERLERSSAFATPSQYFETKDGFVNVSVFSDKFWERLCKVLGLETLLRKDDYSTPERRMVNKAALLPLLEKVFRRETASHWMKVLGREGIPCGPIYTYEDMFRDRNLRIDEYLVEFDHPVAGNIRAMGTPFMGPVLSRGRAKPPPLLGQDNGEVFGSLGLTEEEISEMSGSGII